jgi:hypothetical protein
MLPYYLAKTLSDLQLSWGVPTLFAASVYWTVGFRPTAWAFVVYMVSVFSTITSAQTTGLIFSTSMSDSTFAGSVTFVLWLLIMLVGGFYMPADSIPAAVSLACHPHT